MPDYINYYPSSDIIVFPSSNSTDEGKLTLEENIRDIVTRITNRNYTLPSGNYDKDGIQIPSLNVTIESDKLRIDTGSANINGYKVITNNPIYLDIPEKTDTPTNLGMILTYDGSDHIRGDKVDGAYIVFEGVWIGYLEKYPDKYNNSDCLLIATITYVGNRLVITRNPEIEQRINPEDISITIPGPKPPAQITNLKQFIIDMPNWYVSKYGDTICGDGIGDGSLHFYKRKSSTNPSISITPGNLHSSSLGGVITSTAYNNGDTITTTLNSSLTSKSGISFDITGTTNSSSFIGYIVGSNETFGISSDGASISMRSGQLDIKSNNGEDILLQSSNGNTSDMYLKASPSKISISNSSLDSKFPLGAILWTTTDGNLIHKIGKLRFASTGSDNSICSIMNEGNSIISIDPGIYSKDIRANEIYSNFTKYPNGHIYIGEEFRKYSSGVIKTKINSLGIETNRLIVRESNLPENIVDIIADNNQSYLKISSTRSSNSVNSPTSSYIQLKYKEGSNTKAITIAPDTMAGTNTLLKITGDARVVGNFRASKVYNAVYNDYAEWYEKDNIDEIFEPGDVIELNPSTGKYRKSISNSSKLVVGVYSDSYGHILGGEELPDMESNSKKYIPIGISGRVRVKVVGKVNIGDLLVSTSDGRAMVANEYIPGTIIGKALSNSGGTNKVTMQIMLG